jgi:hypothetical protein
MLSKKPEKAAKEYARKTPPEDRALARVVSGDQVRPGPYNVLPILGSLHKGKNTAFVHLSTFLLRIADDEHVGVMNWVLPFNIRTEKSIVRLLASLGWDGRVWPADEGWPGDTKEARGLRELLRGQNLLSTLTFPPDGENGNRVMRLDVLRTSGEFPLSPEFGEGGIPPQSGMLDKLRELANDPCVFGMGGF